MWSMGSDWAGRLTAWSTELLTPPRPCDSRHKPSILPSTLCQEHPGQGWAQIVWVPRLQRPKASADPPHQSSTQPRKAPSLQTGDLSLQRGRLPVISPEVMTGTAFVHHHHPYPLVSLRMHSSLGLPRSILPALSHLILIKTKALRGQETCPEVSRYCAHS